MATPKSKTGMFIGIAATLAVIGVGSWVALKPKGGATVDPLNQQIGSQAPTGSGTPTVTPTDIAAAFTAIEPMTDVLGDATATSATLAIAKLDSLASLATGDTSRARIVFLRARAHFVLSYKAATPAEKSRELRAACSLLLDNEGLAGRTGFGKQFTFFLKGDPAASIPALCP